MTNAEISYRVAAIQFEPALFQKEANIARLVALTTEAARNGARLIVHPEMATTGYCWASRSEIAPYVETIPGPTTDRFGLVAARFNCYIVAAIPEIAPETGIYYNSAALIGPNGLIGVYRKVHSYISEPKWAKDGDLGFPVFETELGRIAITICMDAVFPESGRIPALAGADVHCFPTNWLSEKCPAGTWMARALDNGCYFIAANRYGLERGVQFSGGSCVIDPDGAVQSSLDVGDGVVYGTVDLDHARDKRWHPDSTDDRIADRRPDTYGSLALNTYRWQDRDFHGLYGINPLPEGRKSTVVAVQFAPQAGEIEQNLAAMERLLDANSAADLVVFPELSATGPIDDAFEAAAAGRAYPQILTELESMANRHDGFLVAGVVLPDADRLFNAALLVGPNGLAGIYRKVHLTGYDRRWAAAGDSLPTFNIPVGRVGILIGYDALFPEAATSLAIDGADIIACPSLLSGPAIRSLGPTAIPLQHASEAGFTPLHFHLWRERARETNSAIVFANGASPSMGFSGVFAAAVEDNTAFQVVIDGAAEGSVVFTIDTTNLDTRYKTSQIRAKDVLTMRVPVWYDALQRPNRVTMVESTESRLVSAHGDD